jgi:DNA-directed RNA polymerase subunit RPC12/RpoP
MDSATKRRHRCPVCGSKEITRMSHDWRAKLTAWFLGAHKFKCFVCGHQFVGHHRPGSESERDLD